MAITISDNLTIEPAERVCNWSGDPLNIYIGSSAYCGPDGKIDIYEFWVYSPDFPGVMVRCDSYQGACHILNLMRLTDG